MKRVGPLPPLPEQALGLHAMPKTARKTPPPDASVAAYLARQTPQVLERLSAIRGVVLKLAPDATEAISYGMPSYKVSGRPLVYFAAYDHHIGVYALPKAHARLEAELACYKRGKGSVQFPHDRKLPMALIGKLIAARLEELAAARSGRSRT